MAKKKAPKARAERTRSAEDEKAMKGGNALTGAVYHKGRMYDHTKARDQRDFAALVEKEGLATDGVDSKDKSKSHKDALQALAESGAIKGYGTKAAAKKSDEDEEDPGDTLTTHPSAADAREASEENEG